MKKSDARIIGVLAVIITLISCRKPDNQITETVNMKDSEMVLETNRHTLRSNWFADAKIVAEMTQNKEALSIAAFLEENSVLAEPHPNGLKYIEGQRSDLWFTVVPITVEDKTAGPIWTKFYSVYESGGAAHFLPDRRTIVLKSHIRMTSAWRGILMLHEGRHALEFLTRQYDWQNQETYCNEERDTHEFNNLLVESIGGPAYVAFVQSLSESIEAKIRQKGRSPGDIMMSVEEYHPELEQIFQPSLSPLERDFRENLVNIHAHFIMLERNFKDEASRKKSELLFALYKHTKVL